MNPTEENVMETVRSKQPTTPSAVANELFDVSGTPKQKSEQYQELESEIRSLMVDMADKGRFQINLEWEFSVSEEITGSGGKGFRQKITEFLS